MIPILRVMKALAEQQRLWAFLALLGTEELCVCEIGELLGLAPATVSRHMSLLGEARLVEARKEGKWVYYRLSPEVSPLLLQWIKEALPKNEFLMEKNRISDICACHRTPTESSQPDR